MEENEKIRESILFEYQKLLITLKKVNSELNEISQASASTEAKYNQLQFDLPSVATYLKSSVYQYFQNMSLDVDGDEV